MPVPLQTRFKPSQRGEFGFVQHSFAVSLIGMLLSLKHHPSLSSFPSLFKTELYLILPLGFPVELRHEGSLDFFVSFFEKLGLGASIQV